MFDYFVISWISSKHITLTVSVLLPKFRCVPLDVLWSRHGWRVINFRHEFRKHFNIVYIDFMIIMLLILNNAAREVTNWSHILIILIKNIGATCPRYLHVIFTKLIDPFQQGLPMYLACQQQAIECSTCRSLYLYIHVVDKHFKYLTNSINQYNDNIVLY